MGKAKRRAVAAGHICLDITPSISQERSFQNIGECLLPGHLVPVGRPDIHIGGSVGNTGLAMKLLGADVKLMGKVGEDDFGRLVLSGLETYGAGEGMQIAPGEETSYSVILSVAGIDRVILHDSGTNHTFDLEDVDFDLVKGASLFHFGYPPVMRGMYREEGAPLLEMLRRVKALGTATSLDMSMADEDSDAGAVDWEALIRRIMPYVDIFAPSAEELAFLIDRPRYISWRERSGDGDITEHLCVERDIRPLADRLLDWGAKIVLIKCGAPGLYLRTGDAARLREAGGGLGDALSAWADVEHFERSYKPARVLSATGAGDTSIAAFLCAILEECPWEEALRLAAATGACCVESYDALSGLKGFAELRRKIEAGWEKA